MLGQGGGGTIEKCGRGEKTPLTLHLISEGNLASLFLTYNGFHLHWEYLGAHGPPEDRLIYLFPLSAIPNKV